MSNNEPRDASHYRNGFSNPAGRISELENLLEFAQKEIDGLRARVAELGEDARRYQFVRGQHWSDGELCVVRNPKRFVKLGAYCPSGEQLDGAIDEAEKPGGGQ